MDLPHLLNIFQPSISLQTPIFSAQEALVRGGRQKSLPRQAGSASSTPPALENRKALDRHAQQVEKAVPAGLAVLNKRKLLLGLLAVLPAAAVPGKAISAPLLKSISSEKPCVITFQNKTDNLFFKIYWSNYDGDQEFFAVLPPSGQYTIDSFKTHPWRIVDANSGQVVKTYVAGEGFQLVPVTAPAEGEPAVQQASASGAEEGSSAQFLGFDGIGGSSADYASAEISQVSIDVDGGLAALKVEGFQEPLPLAVGVPEAAALLFAAGLESRRPSTLQTWGHSLALAGASVERVVITRLVGHTYYARIVLAQGGSLRSLDSRPSDSLALALQSSAPVFVNRNLARESQEELLGILESKKPAHAPNRLRGPSRLQEEEPLEPLDAEVLDSLEDSLEEAPQRA